MKSDLELVKKVLRSFMKELEAKKNLDSHISAVTHAPFTLEDHEPDFNNAEFVPTEPSLLEKENAYAWIYADTNSFGALRYKSKASRMPKYYQQPAQPLYRQWHNLEKKVIYRGCAIIPSPGKISLGEYLQQLSSTIVDKNEKRAVWIKSLDCFCKFIRERLPLELQGGLEIIFPQKSEIRHDSSFVRAENGIQAINRSYIVRKVPPEVYPIDILAAAEILQSLATTVLNGRPNSQHTAAEALGLALLCHTAGTARAMTQEQILYNALLTDLKPFDCIEPVGYSQAEYHINIRTFFGFTDIPISKTVYEFLIALPRESGCPRIFSKPLSSLLRTLYDKGVNKSVRASKLGKITFLTFMSQSTEFFNHRAGYQTVTH